MKLSIVVAAYNEEPVILRNLERIVEQAQSRPEVDWELICVDDGSRDGTGRLMDEFSRSCPEATVLHHRRNFGQGRALRTAFDVCRGDVVVTLDADLSYGPEYIHRLYDCLAQSPVEIALASPYAKGGEVYNVPISRHILSRLGNRYLAKMSQHPVSTTTCVVRAYRREVLDSLVLTSDGMELQLEVLMKAAMVGFRVMELPARLEWSKDKPRGGPKRRSKMRILRTIRLYLFMGWLSKPASLFLVLSMLLLLPGGYMAAVLSFRIAQVILDNLGSGLAQAITIGFRSIFSTYTYTCVFSCAFLLIGINMLSYALLALQNKFYFEELYRTGIAGMVRKAGR